MQITLTAEELKFIRSFCVLRPIKAAIEMLSEIDSPDKTGQRQAVIEDLDEAGPIFERIRTKLVEASWAERKPT